MRVEFLRAWENNYWDTEVHEVPSIKDDPKNGVDLDSDTVDSDLQDWANRFLAGQTQYRKVVLWIVYAIDGV